MELFSILNFITVSLCIVAIILSFKKAITKKDYQIRWGLTSLICITEFWMGLSTEQGSKINIILGFVWLVISLIWYIGIQNFDRVEKDKEKYIK